MIISMAKGYIISRMVMSMKVNSKKESATEGEYIIMSARISKRSKNKTIHLGINYFL